MIKIIFFDIDGTLLNLGAKECTDKVKYALNQLRENEIKIFIATGRPSYVIPDLGIHFDGYLSFNGQYCFNDHEDIYKNPLDKKDVQTMINNTVKMNIPVVLAGRNEMGCNYHCPILDEYFSIANQTIHKLDNFTEFSKGDIFQAMVGITKDKDEQLLENCENIVVTRWWPKACDIIPKNGGKEFGIQKILEYYGYSQEESMAFGDGGNDKTMLEYAGCGVAMGNAVDEVKAIADYVTESVENDGIFSALKHFNLIK